jgi:hypothetical protein
MSFPKLALVLTAVASLAACESAERRDAQVVLEAVVRFRKADGPSTPAAFDALKATPCVAPDVCHARDVCLAAGDPVAKGFRLKAEVERDLAALHDGTLPKDSPEAQDMPRKLEEAEELLKKGRAALAACDEAALALKRKYRI